MVLLIPRRIKELKDGGKKEGRKENAGNGRIGTSVNRQLCGPDCRLMNRHQVILQTTTTSNFLKLQQLLQRFLPTVGAHYGQAQLVRIHQPFRYPGDVLCGNFLNLLHRLVNG